MAYLTERASNQELTATVNNGTQSVNIVDGLNNYAEPNNADISCYLKDKKTNLINLLCNFPATALWLLSQHQQDEYTDNQDDDVSLKSDLVNALNLIKKHYLQTLQSYAVHGVTIDYVRSKQNLSLALAEFPFAFEELTKLVDLMVYAYKFRGFCYQPANQGNPHNHLIIKRLEGLQRPTIIKPSDFTDFFETIEDDGIDTALLFLTGTEMHKLFCELVVAEHLWLAARQQLATANAKLVLFIANQYKANFLDFEDLVQEGQTGLLKAVDRFDHRLGFQFSTYAGYWIRQAISRSLSRCERVVRVPCGQVATISKVYRAKEDLIGKTGKDPTIKEIAEYISMSNDDINMILSISQTTISLETSEDEENSFAPIDFLEQQVFTHAFKSMAKTDLERLLTKAIETLTPREAKVIYSHFGLAGDQEMTLQEIGSELNLTRERIRQIQATALNKIKLNFGQQLMCFL